MVAQAVVRVVDDDKSLLEAVSRTLESSGWDVESYSSGESFFADYDAATPGCIVLDVRMPGISGVSVQHQLGLRGPHAPIIFMSGHADVKTAIRVIRSGAVAWLQKPFGEEDLLEAVEQAVEVDAITRRQENRLTKIRVHIEALTPREYEVLGLVLMGRLNKQIAAELGISQRTVEVHRHHGMKKMRAESVVELLNMMRDVDDADSSNAGVRRVTARSLASPRHGMPISSRPSVGR